MPVELIRAMIEVL